MQATDSQIFGNPLVGAGAEARIRRKLEELQPEVGAEVVSDLFEITADRTRTTDSLRDALSTRLMEQFRIDRSRGCFGLLYELNSQHLLAQVASRLRRYASKADPHDVVQEVFFNVYRYPHRFNSAREDAFRVWSAMIVRNTVLKHLRSQGRGGRSEVQFEDLSDQPEATSKNPLTGAIEVESSAECSKVYVTYLQLYLRFYGMLSERERRALHLVEVDGRSYRVAAEELDIKLENLKMVIFRARRKIHRAMRRVFDGLSPDCRPARDPKGRVSNSGASSSRQPKNGGADNRASVMESDVCSTSRLADADVTELDGVQAKNSSQVDTSQADLDRAIGDDEL